MSIIDIEALASNPIVDIGGAVIGFLGFILAIFFYIRSQKNKVPCFDSSSNTIIEGLHNAFEELEVRYKGIAQKQITVTKIVFWNDGRETINKSDLVERDPLRIICPKGIDILDIQIVNDSAKLNSIALENQRTDEGEIFYSISFEYLDHREYFVTQIIHNGTTSDRFFISGKIKGVKIINEGFRKTLPNSNNPFMKPLEGEVYYHSPRLFKYIGVFMPFLGACVAIWNLFIGNTQWYVWLVIPILLFFSAMIYFDYRHISPVKI